MAANTKAIPGPNPWEEREWLVERRERIALVREGSGDALIPQLFAAMGEAFADRMTVEHDGTDRYEVTGPDGGFIVTVEETGAAEQ